MTACLNGQNLALHPARGADRKKRASLRTWVSSPFVPRARPSSEVALNKDLKLSTSVMGSSFFSPVLGQKNTIGVIGGMSALSTLSFLERLVRLGVRNEGESPPFIVCSDPEVRREFASLRRGSSVPPAPMVENLRRKRLFLEQAGAGCLVMPCHVSHAWFEEVSRGCSVPFLHVGRCVAHELEAAKLKPVERGSSIRVGVVASDPMLSTAIYHEELEKQGFEVITPDEATMEHTILPAMDALGRNDIEGARNLLRIALQILLTHDVKTIILASDDLQGLLPPEDPLLKKCTDTMDVLARCTIRLVYSKNL